MLKYLSGNSAHGCQNAFSFGRKALTPDQGLCPWTTLGAKPLYTHYRLVLPCSPWPTFPFSGSISIDIIIILNSSSSSNSSSYLYKKQLGFASKMHHIGLMFER